MTCRTRAEAENALAQATKIPRQAGRDAHNRGEDPDCAYLERLREFLGFKIQQGRNRFKLSRDRIKSRLKPTGSLRHSDAEIVGPVQGSDQSPDQRQVPLRLGELIQSINPVIRGWGNYYCRRSHVRKRFHQLDGWIIRKALVAPCKAVAERGLEDASNQAASGSEFGAGKPCFVLIPSLSRSLQNPFMKAGCGKTARPV